SLVVLSPAAAPAQARRVASMTQEDMDQAFDISFNLYSGSHGRTREGATGPAVTADTLSARGAPYIHADPTSDLPGGMPDWGRQGLLDQAEMELMAKYLLNEVPEPPMLSFQEIYDSWNLIVPVDERPTSPQTDRNWENYFGVILRDAGQVAIIDGDTKD